MSLRTVTKSKGGVEDLFLGFDSEEQVRGDASYTINALDVAFSVATINEMKALDIAIFTRARVYAGTLEFQDYIYDRLRSDGDESSDTGSGSWFKVAKVHIVSTVAEMKRRVFPANALVQTKGYTTTGDSGGTLYLKRTVAQYPGTPDEFGDHTCDDSTIAELANNVPNWFQLGLIDGAPDNAPAVKAMFENRHRTVIAHAANITIASKVSAVLTGGKHVTSVGQGRRSIINYTNPAAAILITAPVATYAVTLAGIGFTASVDTTEPALDIVFPVEAGWFRRQVTIANCDFISATGSSVAFFDGIVLQNVWVSSITGCVVQGDLTDATKMLAALTFKGNSTGINITDNQFNHLIDGIVIFDTSGDLIVDGNRITQVNVGLVSFVSSSVPRLVFSDNSLSCRSAGLVLLNQDDAVITGNRINRTGDGTGSFHDVDVKNCVGIVINDNLTVGLGASGTVHGIRFENVQKGSIRGNVMQDRALLIELDATTTRVAGDGNINDLATTLLLDNGAGNLIRDAFVP